MTKILSVLYAIPILVVLASCNPEMTERQVEAYTNAKKLYLAGDLDKALETVSTEKFSVRQGHQALVLKARILFFQGQTDAAELELNRILGHIENYTEARIWLGRTLLAKGDTAAAQHCLEKALEFNPEDPRLLSLMGTTREILKDYQQALEYHSRAALYGEDLARTEISLAHLYYRFGQDKEALSHVHRAQALIMDNSVLRRPLREVEKLMTAELSDDL